jgi:hypothetical protein
VKARLDPHVAADLPFATSASRHVVDLLVLAADDAEDLQIRRSRGGVSLRLASLRALLRAQIREAADAVSRPDLPWVSPDSRMSVVCV